MKAVSPLVAAVLLIAVTMTIAGMLAYWASSFVRQRTEQFGNTTLTSECQFADFRVYQCTYNSTLERVSIILNNIRSVDMRELKAYVVYKNGTLSAAVDLNTTLPAGAVQPFYVNGVTPDFAKIIIKTHCTDLSVEDDCK